MYFCLKTGHPFRKSTYPSAIVLILASPSSCFISPPCLLKDVLKSISHLGLSHFFNEQRHQLLILLPGMALSFLKLTE